MKILQVINSLNTGGAEKLMLDAIPKYIEKGIKMDLLLLDGTEYPFCAEIKKNIDINVFSIGKTNVYNPFLIFKIIPFLKQYDLIHVHLFPSLYWVALAKWLSFSKVKLVYTEHSTSNRRRNNWLLKSIDQFIYSKYIKLICITDEVQTHLQQQLKFSNDAFTVLPNGIDLNKIESAKGYDKAALNLPIPIEAKLLLQVSSFQFPKDQATVIKSLKFLSDDVHLLLVGEGILLEQAKELVTTLNLDKRVHFLGVRMDVPKLLKTADIIILSSQYEGLSLSCIEGMSSGKPFIASDVPGLKEIVQGAGVLFRFKDDQHLADCLTKLINNPEYCTSIINQCLLRAKQFDSNLMIDRHINLYKKLQ
jgi:glycosyltransferase involved in cell wall biosynthesis